MHLRRFAARSPAMLPLIAVLLLAGCRAAAPGEIQRIGPQLAPQPVEAVELYLTEPARPYTVIAELNASATSRGWPTLQETEAAAYERLRQLAAQAGATAVIVTEQEILRDGILVMRHAPQEPISAIGDEYTVRVRAKAVRLRP
jgi:hypothetical protein